MNYTLAYRLSLWLTILLTILAYLFLLRWGGLLITGAGSPIPWLPLLLLLLTFVNCVIRSRMIKWRMPREAV
jgi:hypothetical protein